MQLVKHVAVFVPRGSGTFRGVSPPTDQAPDAEKLRYRSGPGRWALAAVILGSGAAFFESSVVSVALPKIGRDLDLSLGGLQWVMNAYLLTLSALMITGGSMGDIYGRRRVFVGGLAGFGAASALCALAPTGEILIFARILQGIAGALVVPSSLAIIQASFAKEDRGAAIGLWSGFSGISSLFGPFFGGWLVDTTSWRLVFAVVLLFAGVAAWTALRHLPESRARDDEGSRPDWIGSALVSFGLGAVTYALIEAPGHDFLSARVLLPVVGGTALLVAFLLVERRVENPMLPLGVFRSRQFSGANAATLCNYMAIGSLFFFLSLQLQDVLGYSALQAGAATIPPTVIMLLFSPLAGRVGQRIGPRIPMTVGPIVMGGGVALMHGLGKGDSYLTDVLPGVVVFGIGMTIFVAPLTTAVLAALPDRQAGIASAVNNAVARIAQLMASAALPAAAGLSAGTAVASAEFSAGFDRAMLITAGIAVAGGVISFLTIRGGRVRPDPGTAAAAADPG